MALQTRRGARSQPGARRGVSAGKSATAEPKVSYTVKKAVTNGGKIAGKRRQVGDVFLAHARHMTYLVIEGIVALTPPATPTPAPPPAPPSSASSSSSTSSASSSSSASSASTK